MNEENAAVTDILIVEDDENMQELYNMFFIDESDKYNIDIAGDAKIAIRKLRKGTYQLIILDMLMEHMDGKAFYVYIRNHTRTMKTPVLVASVVNPDTLQELKELGHFYSIQKPFEKEELLTKIEEIMTE